MLQPQKKKLNPAQKTRAITSKSKSKVPASYDVDWDAVRAVNDNVAVQTVKMFDPTGISSYPDVYYAAKDLSEGKGSVGNLVMNIVGALPMVGKAKAIFRLGKAANASKTVKNTVKVAKATEKLAAKANKATSLVPLATSANRAKKVVGKTAVQAERLAKWMSKPITPKSVRTSSKVFGKTDAKNLAVDILDLANVSADAASVAKQIPGAAKQTVENTKKVVKATEEVTKRVIDKTEKLLETPSPIDKKKVIQYYNTDPKRGEVEKPGQLADVQYVPVSNSIQLEKWKEQKLAFGTGEDGIGDPPTSMFKKPSILQQEYIDPIYSYSERTKLYPGEKKVFKERPDVAGMATGDNRVIINPWSPISKEMKDLVRTNETARLAMRNGYPRPDFELTPKQQEFFSTIQNGKPYSEDLQDIKETIAARVMTGDDSAQDYTKEQELYADKLFDVLKKSKEYATGMTGMMKSKIGMGNAFEQPAIKRMSQAMPKTGMTPEGIGTHYMSSVDNYAVPELQDFGGTGLTLVDPDSKSKEAIKFNSPEEAEYFAKHYKEVAPMTNMFGELNSFSYGTNSQGIMKSKMNPRKKYANGSSAKGMNVNNYIISPAEALADYDIMMAKVEQKAMSNPWLPIVAAVGGAAQSFVGNSSNYINKGNFTTSGTGLNLVDTTKQSPIGDRYKKAMGTNSIQADAEVEGGEVYETPQGEVGEFQGPSHEQGGIPLEVGQDVEEGTKVYSDRLKLGKKTLAERKETRERQIANLEKIASEPLIDQAVKNATKRKMMAIQKEESADLAFQEKVNNMQQMADTMVAAYGTSMAGLQDNPVGDSMRYAWGTDDTGINPPWMLPSSTIADYDPDWKDKMTMDQIQTIIGSDPDGTWGRKDRRKARQFIKDKNQSAFPSWARGGKGITKNQSDMEQALADEDFQKQFRRVYLGDPYSQEELDAQAAEDAEFYVPGEQIGVAKKENLPGTVFSRTLKNIFTGNKDKENKVEGVEEGAEKPTAMGNLMRSLPGMGDMTKIAGNILGMTSGIKTANEQRATDIPFQNVYRNAGEEAQRMLDNAKQGIETNKAQAIVKATSNTRGGMKGARNSARGVNQMRGMDWLYNTALNQQVADITAGAAEKISAIDMQKSGVSMNADQLKGQGEWQRMTADAAAKDAYYTALGLGRKDFATGLQQTGKDINSMKENKIIENLMKNYGKWVGADGAGNLANINKKTAEKGTENKIEVPDGKGGTISMTKAEFEKLMEKVTNTK